MKKDSSRMKDSLSKFISSFLNTPSADLNDNKLKEKYGNTKIEDVILDDTIEYELKVKILIRLHNYSEEEAQELLEIAEKEVRRTKLSEIKRKIVQKIQERYSAIPVDDARQPIPDDVKMFVWQRDQGKCVKCGSQKNLEFDHIIPVSKGGSNTERNIQLLCEDCNRSKHDNI